MGCCGGGSTLKCCGVGTCPHTAASASHRQAAGGCKVKAGIGMWPWADQGSLGCATLLPVLLSAACEMMQTCLMGRQSCNQGCKPSRDILSTLVGSRTQLRKGLQLGPPSQSQIARAEVFQQTRVAHLAPHAAASRRRARGFRTVSKSRGMVGTCGGGV